MSESELSPEPWPVHLLGLVNPMIVIAGNLLGGAYTAMGVVFVWGVGPFLDIVFGESKQPRPPRESGLPFETLLWVHGIVHFVVLASFFRFAYLEASVSLWLVVAALSTGLSAAASAIVTAHELGHKKPKSPGWRLAKFLLFSVHYSPLHHRAQSQPPQVGRDGSRPSKRLRGRGTVVVLVQDHPRSVPLFGEGS